MHLKSESPDIAEVKIEKALEALPDKTRFTPFMDKMILKFYKTKGPVAVGRILSLRHTQVAARYHFIKDRPWKA